jgi:hypothetical protein
MSNVVYGRPQIIDVLVANALDIADTRDAHYHNPPDYLCEEPQNTSARTQNLQQTNVNGYKLQDQHKKAALEQITNQHNCREQPSSAEVAQALVTELMNTATYRLDTNFAKIDRIDHVEVEACKARVLKSISHGKTNAEWRKLLRQLDGDSDPLAQAEASAEILRVYSKP